jgi:hypothetical protein
MSNSEIAIDVMIWGFIGSISIGSIIFASVLIKKCYIKYVMDLPDEDNDDELNIQEQSIRTHAFQIHTVPNINYVEFTEICVLDNTSSNIINNIAIAEEVV